MLRPSVARWETEEVWAARRDFVMAVLGHPAALAGGRGVLRTATSVDVQAAVLALVTMAPRILGDAFFEKVCSCGCVAVRVSGGGRWC
jgi:hypothetical protein